MKYSYSWLNEYLDNKLPAPEKTAADLTGRAFEVEEIKKVGQDFVFDIKILPNRAADCLSHLGIARELAAIYNLKFEEPANKLTEELALKIEDFLSVDVKDKKLCPRYSARMLTEIKVGESPDWLKEKLIVCGLRPINNIVDATNFVMLEYGQPLHAFDYDKLNPNDANKKTIIVRQAKRGEKIITLDEGRAERVLDENVLVIADTKNPVAIAGIKGGKGPEIGATTKRIVLEAANFEPINIRRSSKSLNLRTDASVRFENSPDMNLTLLALDRATALIYEIANGKIMAGVIDVKEKENEPWPVGVAHQYIESLLGLKISLTEVMKIFQRLGLKPEQREKNGQIFYEILTPTRRPDLLTSEDLIEEVGRLYGYENIKAEMPSGTLIPAIKGEEMVYADGIKDIFVGLGYAEVYNYSFISESDKNLYGFKNLAELDNPLSSEQKYLRPSLAPGFIRNLAENYKYFLTGHNPIGKQGAMRLFELGHIFSQNKELREEKRIGGLIFIKDAKGGGRDNVLLSSKDKNLVFYETKGAVEVLFSKMGVAGVWEDDYLVEGLPDEWRKILTVGRSAQIKVDDKLLGWAGEINSALLEDLAVEGQAAIFEIDFDKMIKLINEERIYQPPSKFPAVIRDLAILVESETKVEAILNIIETAGGELLTDTDLFDIYSSDEGKSLAFHLIFQSNERNLTAEEINELIKKIIKELKDESWEVRI